VVDLARGCGQAKQRGRGAKSIVEFQKEPNW
jgi:hypothetical protein